MRLWHNESEETTSKTTSEKHDQDPAPQTETYCEDGEKRNHGESQSDGSHRINSCRPPPLGSTDARNSFAPLTPITSHQPDAAGFEYPEGGLRAWLVVLGSFTGMTACFGLMNTIGIYNAYLSEHQLKGYSPSVVGWLFSIYIFLAFFCGVLIGPIFDAYGPRLLVALGTVCHVGGMVGLAFSTGTRTKCMHSILSKLTSFTEYWHFLLSISLVVGLGSALIFTPAVAAIAHFFCKKRGVATGLATTGGSIGGVVFPLMLQSLFPKIGFTHSTLVLALLFAVLLVFANLLIRGRLQPARKKSDGKAASVWPDFRIFRNGIFALTTAGVFFLEWGLFVPVTYLSSYALASDVGPTFSYQLLAILNAGSFFGRWIPGHVCDRIGRFNTMIITLVMCLVGVLGIWLNVGGSVPGLVIFAILFGFGSGSNISLAPVCVGQLCGTEVFGRWYATCYCIVSIGCLTGVPIAGQILADEDGSYKGLIGFTGGCYVAGLVCFVAARVIRTGWRLRVIF